MMCNGWLELQLECTLPALALFFGSIISPLSLESAIEPFCILSVGAGAINGQNLRNDEVSIRIFKEDDTERFVFFDRVVMHVALEHAGESDARIIRQVTKPAQPHVDSESRFVRKCGDERVRRTEGFGAGWMPQ